MSFSIFVTSYSCHIIKNTSVVVRSGAGRPGALRGGAKPIFAPAGALGRGEAILRPGLGRWGGAKPFCAPAGALGRGEAILRPELGRWGGALMYFGPSGAPHAPGRLQRPCNNKYEV